MLHTMWDCHISVICHNHNHMIIYHTKESSGIIMSYNIFIIYWPYKLYIAYKVG